MSDTKKPTVSEIRARNERARKHSRYHYRPAASRALFREIPYFLDLVERMGKALSECRCPKRYCGRVVGEPYGFEDCADCKEARALLEEIKL